MTPGFPGRPGPRILILAPNWLGDVVMATPLLTQLRQAVFGPGDDPATLILAVRRPWVELFRGDDRLDEILVVERTGCHAGVGGLVRLAGDFRRVRADAVVLGPPSLRAAAAAWLAGIPWRVGFRTDGRALLLHPGLAFPGKGMEHYSRQLLALGREAVGRLNGRPGWDAAEDPLPSLSPPPPLAMAGLPGGPPVWAMGVGTTYGPAKVWPADRVWEFLADAVRRYQVRVVLLGNGPGFGSPPEAAEAAKLPVRKELAGGTGVVDLVGRTTLPEVATILQKAEVFVGNDSGLMHLAAALGTPTVGIFGSSDPRWTSPLGDHTAVVQPSGFACSPCFRSTCNQPEFCLATLGAAQVTEAVARLTARRPPGEAGLK